MDGQYSHKCLCKAGPSRGEGGGWKVFLGLAMLGGLPVLKNTEKGVPRVVFLTSNMHKIHFRLGSAPDPAGELTMLPHTPSRMVRGHPTPRFLPSRCLDLGPYRMKL